MQAQTIEKPGLSRSMRIAFWMIGSFLTGAVLWLGIFVKIAVAHSEPPIDNRFFEKGKSYNDRFRSLEQGKASGLQIESNLHDGQSFAAGPIQAAFQLKSGVPIETIDGSITLERAATSRDRQKIRIDSKDFNTSFNPGSGIWDLRLDYTVNGSLAVHRNIRITVN